MRNLQEQVKKAFCYKKLFWPFTVWINCYSDLKKFANSRPSVSNFKTFSQSLEKCLHTGGQNNFGNKIPLFMLSVLLNWLKLVYGPCSILIPCPTYIVMMAQLMYNQKAIHYCLWAIKKKEEQIVELHISWCLTPFPLLPKIYFFGQKAVSSLPLVFPFLDFGDWKAVRRQEKRFFLLLAFYRSCTILDASFALLAFVR